MRLASIIIHKATRGIIAKGARIAAHVLEAPAAEIEFDDGRFAWKGTDRSLDLFEVAAAALDRRDLPDELRGALAETCDETVNVAGYRLWLARLRGRDRPGDRAWSRSCATPPSTTSGAP